MPGTSILNEYLAERKALVDKDVSLRQDRAKYASMSEIERVAEGIVRRIRKEEALRVWSHEQDLFPGMAFLTARETIESTQIFKILKKMPKGALLHAHLEATVDTLTLLKLGLEHDNMCIRSFEQITPANLSQLLPQFGAQPVTGEREYMKTSTITDVGYIPESWICARRAREEWPASMGGSGGFDAWVVKSMVINPEEAYGTHNTTRKIWIKFVGAFSVIYGIIMYEPVLVKYLRCLFESCVEDGIQYVEVRMDCTPKGMLAADGVSTIDRDHILAIFKNVRDGCAKELRADGRGDLFQGAKFIYTVLRWLSPEELEWHLDECLQLKQKYPDVIAGFDLVGAEDSGRPLIDYLTPLIAFQERVKELGIKIPFIFHAGETLDDGGQTDGNLYDAILLGSKRIGHGFSLIKHPHLMRVCREKGILVESCPISNEILRLTSSIPAHPISAMLNHGVPIALGCDDPGIFANMGLTYDFFQVFVASEITGLMTLATIARHSIEYSEMNPEEKESAMEVWERRWQQFVQEIVNKNGAL